MLPSARALPQRVMPLPSLVVAVAFALSVCHCRAEGQSAGPSACYPPTTIGFHAAACFPDGNLALPPAFASLEDALSRAVAWYQKSPLNEHGFPPVVCFVTTYRLSGRG